MSFVITNNTFLWPEAHLVGTGESLPRPWEGKPAGSSTTPPSEQARGLLFCTATVGPHATPSGPRTSVPPTTPPQKSKTTIMTCPTIIWIAPFVVSGKNPCSVISLAHALPQRRALTNTHHSLAKRNNSGPGELHWEGAENYCCCQDL